MSKQTAVRLEDETYLRLQTLAMKTGRTATYYIREAIEAHLEEIEDLYLAEQTLDAVRLGKQRIYSANEVDKELGLAD